MTQSYGTPLKFILKGNTQFIINYGKSGGEFATYEADGAYVTFFYDLHKDQTVTGIQVVEKGTEQSLKAFYPKGASRAGFRLRAPKLGPCQCTPGKARSSGLRLG